MRKLVIKLAALGQHILVEFLGCNPEIMNDVTAIENSMVASAKKAGATVINSTFHHFSPYGVSGVVVIQESHLAIHTWPEYGYAAVDLFTCGDEVDPWVSFDFLKEAFEATNYSALEMKRGSLSLMKRNDFKMNEHYEPGAEEAIDPRFTRDVWFTDRDKNQALSLRYTGDILYRKESDMQRVSVLESFAYGKMLAIDNMVMTTEKDEFHYHEMIAHPAMLTHGKVKNILVIGGGDGGTIRELFKYDVDQITMVEIDANVIEACKAHLPEIASEFDNPKLNLIVGDGIAYVKEAQNEAYDLVIVDGSDPVGPAEGLFGAEFYNNCHRILKSDGILVTQGESPKFNESTFVELNHLLQNVFGDQKVHTSLFYVPTYPTGMWSFQWGVKGSQNPNDLDKESIANKLKDISTKYYNEDIHHASFALPNFVKDMLKK